MNEDFLLDALNEISDEHIAEAALYEKKIKIKWYKAVPVAACLVLIAATAFTAVRHTGPEPPTNASVIDTSAATTAAPAPTTAAPADTQAGITAAPAITDAPEITSEATTVASADTTVAGVTESTNPNEAQTTVGCLTTVAWENAPYSYCYREFSFEGINYINHSGALTGEDSLGSLLGSVVLTSEDDNGNKQSVNADVYEIKGVSNKCAVALYFKDGVQMKNCAQGYYVYYNKCYTPETLGQAMDEMNFREKMLFGQSDIYIYYDAQTDDGKVITRNYLINESAIKAFKDLLDNNKNLKGESFERDSMIRSQNLTIGASYLGSWISFRLNGDGYLYFGLGDNELQYNIGKDNFEKLLKVVDSECQVENSTAPALAMTTSGTTQGH